MWMEGPILHIYVGAILKMKILANLLLFKLLRPAEAPEDF